MKEIRELPIELFMDESLCSFLAEFWFSFANHFPQIQSQLPEIQYDKVSNTEKVRMVYLRLIQATEIISVDSLVTFLDHFRK